jgi:hypothetical protein
LSLLEPVDEAGIACDMKCRCAKELIESHDELPGGSWLTARKASVGRQDQTPMVTAICDAAVVDRDEITLVVGDKRAVFTLRPVEKIFVGGAAQVSALGDGDDIVIALAQLLSYSCRIHLIK